MGGDTVLGGLAGLGTACLWAISPITWGLAGRRVTALSVAAVRILLAAVILTVVHWVVFGGPWPTGLDWEPGLFLAVSGILGMGLGDICYFHSLVRIGPRLATLISSTYPIATTLIAWTTMRETLSAQAVCGIVLNVAGVAWVVSEPTDHKTWPREPGHLKQGVILCLVSVVFVSAGIVLSRLAMSAGPRYLSEGGPLPGVDPFQGTVVRVAAAAFLTWILLPFLGRTRSTLAALADRKAMPIMLLGTIVGPTTGVWLSMIAVKHLPAGVASALIGTSPIFMIPLCTLAYGEKHTFRSVVGTCLAIAGVFLLLM